MGVSVCLSARISREIHTQTSRHFLHMSSGAVAGSFSDDSGIRYVLPVLWMTSCFLMGATALGVGIIDAMRRPFWTPNSHKFPTYSPGGAILTLSSYTMAAKCTPVAKSSVDDCLVFVAWRLV